MDSETDCIDTIDLPHPALAIGYKSGLRTGLDIVRLENALRIAADVVAEEGEAYLPIFERIERELHERKLKEEALCRARMISMKQNNAVEISSSAEGDFTREMRTALAYTLAYIFETAASG